MFFGDRTENFIRSELFKSFWLANLSESDLEVEEPLGRGKTKEGNRRLKNYIIKG